MIVGTIVQTALAIVAVIALARLNGLRSFSKMSSFDFALTVACGSLLATMMTSGRGPWPGLVALITLFALRFGISRLRVVFPQLERATDNRPLMLMYDGRLLSENLPRARVSEADITAKLREANALDPAQVRAVVLEATGDVSVLHGHTLDPALLQGVSWGAARPPDGIASRALPSGG